MVVPVRSTDTASVIDSLEKLALVFGNPKRIISDRGTAFTSEAFEEYCKSRFIQHLVIATGVPRGNGQVERIHKILVPMLAKLCKDNPTQWYKHVGRVQQIINNTPPRSTKFAPFKILTGLDMRIADDLGLNELLKEASIDEIHEERNDLRKQAQTNIQKIQQENCKTFNAKRKPETKYKINDLIAVKRTQFGVGLKLKPKFLGPYKVTAVLQHGRYQVKKVGDHEGPGETTTVAEHMKVWKDSFGANESSGRPNVGSVPIRATRSGNTY